MAISMGTEPFSAQNASQVQELFQWEQEIQHTLAIWSRDGSQLAISANWGFIHLYDSKTLAYIRRFGSSTWVGTLALSPDGYTLASGDKDGEIKLFNVSTGDTLYTREGHKRWVSSVVFSPDGRTIASKSVSVYETTIIRFWGVP